METQTQVTSTPQPQTPAAQPPAPSASDKAPATPPAGQSPAPPVSAAPATNEGEKRMAAALATAERRAREALARAEKAERAHGERSKEHETLLSRLKGEERFKALEELGVSYEDWTNTLLKSGDKPKDPGALRLEALEKRIAELAENGKRSEQEKAEAQQAQNQRARIEYAKNLAAKPGSELTLLLGGYTKYVEEADRQMREEGVDPQDLDEEAIRTKVDASTRHEFEAILSTIAEKAPELFKSIVDKLGKASTTTKPGDKPDKQDKPSTLSNELSSTSSQPIDWDKMTDDEKRATAAKRVRDRKKG